MSTATTHDLIHTLSEVSLKRTQTTLKQSLARHIPKNTKGDDKYSRHASILLPLCQVIQHRHGRGFDTKSKGHASFLFTVRSLALRNHAGEVSWPGGVFDPLLDIRHDDSEGFYPTSTPSVEQMQCAALRETLEEVPSLGESDVEILGKMDPVPDKTRTIQVFPFVGYIGTLIAYRHPHSWTPTDTLDFDTKNVTKVSDDECDRCTYYHYCTESGNTKILKWGIDEVSAVFTMSLLELSDPSRLSMHKWTTKRSQFSLTMPVWCGPVINQHISHKIIGEDAFKEMNVMLNSEGIECYRVWGLTAGTLGQFLRSNVGGFHALFRDNEENSKNSKISRL